MALDSFSYTDSVRAAIASCLPCFATSRSEPSASNSTPNSSSNAVNAAQPSARPSSSFNDLEQLLRDSDSDALSLHSNLGAASTHRRAKHRRRPKFSLTLFGYTLFGRPPIYLLDDDDGDDPSGVGGRRTGALATTSSSTLDSDAAPLDASTIERLTSPDHFAALAAQRESEQRRLEAEEEARRKAEQRARRLARKARERASLMSPSSNGTSPRPETGTFEEFHQSGSGMVPTSLLFHPAVEVVPGHLDRNIVDKDGNVDGLNDAYSGDADDADLGGESYTRTKKSSAALSASGSDSRSRTSASFSAGDASHTQSFPVHSMHQSIPYPHTEMRLPAPVKQKSSRASKRTLTVSPATSQSSSTAPYTPVESIAEVPAMPTFPVPQERYIREEGHAGFPSMGLSSGKQSRKSLDPRAFLAHQG